MTPLLYHCKVEHTRHRPKQHAFQYPAIILGAELSQLGGLNRFWPLFGYNRAAVFSVFDKDLIKDGTGALLQKFSDWFNNQTQNNPHSVLLFVLPRYLNYAFQPVSFFVCLDPNKAITHVVAEVHNTFGDTHRYVLENENKDLNGSFSSRFAKQFFVSPFLDLSGTYSLTGDFNQQYMHISVDLMQDNELVFSGSIAGAGKSLTFRWLAYTVLTRPLCGLLTMLRIEWQALKIFIGGKAALASAEEHAKSIAHTSAPSVFDRARLLLIRLVR